MTSDTTAVADAVSLMRQAEGRRFLWNLIESCGTLAPSMALDAETTAFNEGRRSVGLDLMARLQQDAPNEWLKMMVEQATLAAEESLRRQLEAVQRPRADEE